MANIRESDVIAGVYVVEPVVHSDERGLIVETYRKEWISGGREMVQGNRADRRTGSVVGLHYHRTQADYWYLVAGAAWIVLHDLRAGSPTEGKTFSTDLGARSDGTHDHRGIYIPPGIAHGFGALTDVTLTYLVDGYYDTAEEMGVAWDDPDIGADWGITSPVLSARDLANPSRATIARDLW